MSGDLILSTGILFLAICTYFTNARISFELLLNLLSHHGTLFTSYVPSLSDFCLVLGKQNMSFYLKPALMTLYQIVGHTSVTANQMRLWTIKATKYCEPEKFSLRLIISFKIKMHGHDEWETESKTSYILKNMLEMYKKWINRKSFMRLYSQTSYEI